MAEAVLNRLGAGRFQAFSAGSTPAGKVHPYTLDLLRAKGFPENGLRSKSWDEFAASEAPSMDFIFTVCDNAAHEVCPVWPGHPMTFQWGFPDPVQVEGDEQDKRKAFNLVYDMIEERLRAFVNLPINSVDHDDLRKKLKEMAVH